MKKYAILVLILAALALTGCTPKDSSSSGSSNEVNSTTEMPANDGPVEPDNPDEAVSTSATGENDGPASRVEPISAVGEE